MTLIRAAVSGVRKYDEVIGFLSAFATGPGKPSPGSGDMLVLPNFASDSGPEPGKLLPESGDLVPESVACLCLHTLTSAGYTH